MIKFLLITIFCLKFERVKLNKIKCKNEYIKEKNILIPKSNNININQKLLIDTNFYYIYENKHLNKSFIFEQCILQINNLNKGFNNPGFKSKIYYRFYDLTFINNKKYAKDCDKKEKEYKKKFYLNPEHFINVYICPDKNYLGWAYYPYNWEENNYMYGIVIHPDSLPGSIESNYNLGHTLTHEIGHFFGLDHTFNYNGICSYIGDDGFSDTPLEKEPSYNCDHEKDTCPNNPGKDPVWNFMDYSYDRCLINFTPQQIKKMRNILYYKKNKLYHKSIQNAKTNCYCKKRGNRKL